MSGKQAEAAQALCTWLLSYFLITSTCAFLKSLITGSDGDT